MRQLPDLLSAIMTSPQRQPRYQVVLYDILSSGAPTITQVVNGSAVSAFQLDVTAFVHGGVTVDEPGDRRASHVTFSLSDHLGSFDPVSGTYATFMQENQLAHIKVGDASVSTSDYVGVFFGHVRGQVGFSIDRQSLRRETSVSLYGRRATPRYLKRRFTSRTYDAAVDFGTILLDIVRTEMSLGGDELDRWPALLGMVTQFSVNSIVDLTPLEAIDKVLEALGITSDFDGDGKLKTYIRDMRRGYDRRYANLNLIGSVEIPQADTETYNSVKIIGLDKQITQLDQAEEALARATIPVGFWRPSHEVDVWWSNDRSLRAHNTIMVIETSVNDALIVSLGTEEYEETSPYGGRITVGIANFLLTLIAAIVVVMVASFFVPDIAPPFGGPNILVGSILQSIALQLILMTLAIQSSGVYEIRGTAILPVFKEISAVLTIEGTPDYLLNQKEIKNDWINSQEHLLDIAMIELLFEAAQGKPRDVTVVDDYSLEIGDIVQIPLGTNPLRIWIDSLRRTLTRDEVPMLQLSGYVVPEGAF